MPYTEIKLVCSICAEANGIKTGFKANNEAHRKSCDWCGDNQCQLWIAWGVADLEFTE